jgi:RimJ/RimL family protein N-acetyltransferase
MNITFRPLEHADLPMLQGWLARPHVLHWWREVPAIDELAADYLPADPQSNDTRVFIAMQGARAIGFIQCYVVMGSGDGWWEDERDPGARGIDQFLADEADLGTGLGSALVRAFVDGLFDDPTVTVVQTDPAPHNIRAVRAYLKAGFHAQALITTPDGPALLMRRWRNIGPQARSRSLPPEGAARQRTGGAGSVARSLV